VSHLVAWTIWIPLAGAILTFLLRGRYVARGGLLTAGLTLLATAGTVRHVWEQGEQLYQVGGWPAPLGITLNVDGLSAVMIAMTSGVGVLVSWYAWGYFSSGNPTKTADPAAWAETDSFWPLWLFLWAALNAIFLTSDVFNAYVGLEIMSLAAVALVLLAKGKVALSAGLRYLLASLVGSLSYLMGVAMLYAAYGTLDMTLLGGRMEPGLPAWTALGLITAGLMLKSALFPLHFWLPPAHANAPSPVSAILSALVVKASFYLILRLWFDVFRDVSSGFAVQTVGAIGAVAVLWGSIQAIRQTRLKLLIAYSTVAQIGYMFLMIPLALPSPPGEDGILVLNINGWDGGLYQLLSHAFAKAAMFLAAGSILYAMEDTEELTDLVGFASRLPVTTFTFALASVSLMGLPPSGGFAAKWLMLTASVENRQWWWAAVFIVGGLLTAIYIFKVLGKALRDADEDTDVRRVPISMEVPALLLGTIAFLMGLAAANVYDLLEIGRGAFP
jgi:multicomponent Na+:H+ antiporter subunit D